MKQISKNSFVSALLIASLVASPITAFTSNAAITDLTPSSSIVEKVKRDGVPTAAPSLDFSGTGIDQRSMNNALFLLQIQQDLKKAYTDYHSLDSKISSSQEKVSVMNETIGTLREQVISFQHEIDLSAEKIQNIGQQIGLREKELTLLDMEISNRSAALENQKKLLADYMRVLYIKENRFSADGSDEVLSSVKLLLANESVGDTLQEMTTLDMLQHGGQIMLEKFAASEQTITDMQALTSEKKQKLDALKNRLLADRQNLEDQQVAKAKLLELTHGQQQEYEKLIQESQKQEDESLLQIAALQDNFNYIKDNLSRLGNSVTPTDLQKLLDNRTRALYDFQQQNDNGALLQWPVNPSRGISAYFHDDSYKARFGVGHQAIDIPTNQSTQIRAPKDGIVYRAKDNGMGYSYIILSHKGKIMTVYGHVSSILVREGQVVQAGEVIGLTGGMPGTKGAGYMTTGPHLHLEVLKNGEHVDPLDYLSLTLLPLNSLPVKYARRVEEQSMQQHNEANASGETTGASGDTDAADEPAVAPEKTPEEIDAAVEQTGKDEIEVYRRLFGIPKDSGSIQPGEKRP
ncbi:peptidoglycan DD-metalloendopeptidase family protein [Candidatus Gracilibacteria bacterium]|nr:peptidoglycan DD-metalloendopeptidase family protein [Candidatus Gracilibacteria bacterium]